MRMGVRLISFLVLVGTETSLSSQSLAADVDSKEECLAAVDSGQSQRDDGKYSAAREQFVTCARDVCPKLVRQQCSEWLHQLDEAMPTVVLGAKDAQGNDISAARVLSGGKVLASSLDGKPVPLDPGPHDLRFERDNNESATVHVVLRAGEKNRDVTATFAGGEAEPSTPIGAPESTPAPPGAEGGGPSSFWNGRSVTSLSLLAGGAVAVGLGVYFGLHSQTLNNQADQSFKQLGSDNSACAAGSALASQTDCKTLSDKRNAQNQSAILSDVFYVAGGALALGAVATWFLWSQGQEAPASTAWVAPMVGPNRAGMDIGGAF